MTPIAQTWATGIFVCFSVVFFRMWLAHSLQTELPDILVHVMPHLLAGAALLGMGHLGSMKVSFVYTRTGKPSRPSTKGLGFFVCVCACLCIRS